MNKNLAKNIAFLLKHHQLTASTLARKTGIQQPVIHRIASGETTNPQIETLLPIAQYFGIHLEQLLGTLPLTTHLPKMTTLPILSANQIINYLNKQATFDNSSLITTDITVSARAFAMTTSDNTMAPLFPRYTALIFDPNTPYHDHDFVLAQQNDTMVFRQLIYEGDKRYLKPLNQDFQIAPLDKNDQILATLLQAKLTYLKENSYRQQPSTLVSAQITPP